MDYGSFILTKFKNNSIASQGKDILPWMITETIPNSTRIIKSHVTKSFCELEGRSKKTGTKR